jgi:hypothetical protein
MGKSESPTRTFTADIEAAGAATPTAAEVHRWEQEERERRCADLPPSFSTYMLEICEEKRRNCVAFAS